MSVGSLLHTHSFFGFVSQWNVCGIKFCHFSSRSVSFLHICEIIAHNDNCTSTTLFSDATPSIQMLTFRNSLRNPLQDGRRTRYVQPKRLSLAISLYCVTFQKTGCFIFPSPLNTQLPQNTHFVLTHQTISLIDSTHLTLS